VGHVRRAAAAQHGRHAHDPRAAGRRQDGLGRAPRSASSATSTARAWTRPASRRRAVKPVQPELAKIDAIHDVASLRAEISRLQSFGINALFGFGSEPDRKDAQKVIAAAVQGGLGLPERDYYTKTDEKS
jgi:predicted metalloendopeptidase